MCSRLFYFSSRGISTQAQKPGAQPGRTQDGLVPENNPEPKTESKDPTDPDENTQAGHV